MPRWRGFRWDLWAIPRNLARGDDIANALKALVMDHLWKWILRSISDQAGFLP